MSTNISRRAFIAATGAIAAGLLSAGCSVPADGDAPKESGIDYRALVNKQHELPA